MATEKDVRDKFDVQDKKIDRLTERVKKLEKDFADLLRKQS
jgi:hypothetical protein